MTSCSMVSRSITLGEPRQAGRWPASKPCIPSDHRRADGRTRRTHAEPRRRDQPDRRQDRAGRAWLSGNGIKVGIIDTGIDIDHPAFGGGGAPLMTPFPSARVTSGYDLVGDNYNAAGSAPS